VNVHAGHAIAAVERAVGSYGAPRALVAFSGSVDSAVVLSTAARALGSSAVTAVTAVSPSYPAGELGVAREVASAIGVAHRTIETGEVERESYARNDPMRCFHCKTELYTTLARMASTAVPGTVVMAGANADDPGDFRPGLRAASIHGVRNPLLETGIGKDMVRAMARWLGLAVAEKPALACLSSRVAYGIRITSDLLARIDRAERAVRRMGFEQVRVRHLGERASIEVPREEVGRLAGHSGLPALVRRLRGLGWRDVQIDPEGYRTGSLNAAL
jgi:pyridinium-3,5-biscarboxylic acid mononucleotide sulfurtransferase